ncbi:MAG: amidohydrolase family protein [Gemmatimonadota bacterium]
MTPLRLTPQEMLFMTLSFRPAWAVVAGVSLAVPLSAQRNVPSVYAITNARIVPVSAPVIPTGTVVVRDGVITAVGASAAVPGDAQVIDGTGLTVYPGFIDGYGTLALPAPTSGAGGGAAGRVAAAATTRPTGAPNSTNVVGMQPEVAVVDLLDPVDASFTAAHAAGFTAAFTATGTGVFRGHAALINLIGTDVSAMIVKPNVAQSVGFSRGGGGFGGGYPSSLFAVFAALRQELLDAQRYHELTLVYDRNPRGVKRPAYDPSLEALQPVLTRQQPVVMFANSEREILRALDLAKEFNLRVIIAGGSEAYLVADRLKADNVPVLLSVNFPRRSAAATGGAAGGAGAGGRGAAPVDDEPELMRVLRERVEAPKAAGRLATAGVRIVFESANNFTEYLANVRRAVAAGLPADQALRAMTIAPAELFGVADRMGSIETGKIANLTMTKGDLFDTSARVTQLFIDGEPTIIPAPTASAQTARTP